MNIIKYDYVPNDCLPTLNNYKYSGSDNSLIYNHLLSPLANHCLQFVPKTIAYINAFNVKTQYAHIVRLYLYHHPSSHLPRYVQPRTFW